MSTPTSDTSESVVPPVRRISAFKWLTSILEAIQHVGCPFTLQSMYAYFEEKHADVIQGRPNWKARLRATIEADAGFVRVGKGVWDRTSHYKKSEVARFEALRREQYPLLGKRQKKDET